MTAEKLERGIRIQKVCAEAPLIEKMNNKGVSNGSRNLSREEKELGSKRPDVQRRKVRESAKTRENKKDRFPGPSVDKWSIE